MKRRGERPSFISKTHPSAGRNRNSATKTNSSGKPSRCSFALLFFFFFIFFIIYLQRECSTERLSSPSCGYHSPPRQEVSSPRLNGKTLPAAALRFLSAKPRAVFSPEPTSHTKRFQHEPFTSQRLLGRGTARSAGRRRGSGGGQGQDTCTSVPSAALLIKPITGSFV